MRDVETVEKVPRLLLRYADEKIDFSERAVFDNRAYEKGKCPPQNRVFSKSEIFSTDSLAFIHELWESVEWHAGWPITK